MKRIIIHWTAGNNYPSEYDRNFYHYLIDMEGKVYGGKYRPEANENCNDGEYAKHCGGGNTGSIGVALCGMYGYRSVNDVGHYPLTRVQCEKMFYIVAKLCKKYNIPITTQTVLTHYEFGQKHPATSSYGKIDIIFLPPYKEQPRDCIGNFIRSKVRWYYNKL